MCKESKPCYKCERRHVTSEYNCHSHCPDFKELKDEQTARAEVIRKKKAEEADITDFRIQSMARVTRDKSKQNAWKG
jgi:hypothetical protein